MRKLAMLLALCLVVTALPGPWFALGEEADTEDALIGQELELIEIPDVADGEELVGEVGLSGEGLVLEEDGDFSGIPADGEAIDEDFLPDDAAMSANASPVEALSGEEEGTAPHVDPDGPILAATELTLGVGERFLLNPTLPEGKTGKIKFSTDASSVAKVTSAGKVAAVAVGEAHITATAEDGTYAECFVYVKNAPDKVAFASKTVNIGKGEITDPLEVVVGSKDGEFAGACSFKTSNKKYVQVNSLGQLKGVATGKATITVETYNGKKATCTVNVVKAPDKVAVSVDKTTLGLGEKGRIFYKLPSNTAGHADYASENPDVVVVDEKTGEMTGVAVGKTRVRARTYNGKIGIVNITVAPAPKSLTLAAESVKLGVGMTLGAGATLDAGAAGEITYSVKDKSVAVCSDGVLKGVAKGETVLTVKTYNGLKAKCSVVVVDAPASVKLPYKTLDIAVGQSVKLEPNVGKSVSPFTYASKDARIAKVSADGVVMGVKKGGTIVAVKTYNGKTCYLTVNVVDVATSVSLSPSTLELGIGETGQLKCVFPKNTAASVTFASNKKSVATVDKETGVVTGVAPGKAVITATTHNGKTAKAKVEVFSVPEWISVSEDNVTVAVGQKAQIETVMSPGSRSPLTYKSKRTAIAKVSSSGVITGISEGETVITVKTNVKGVTASVNVTVLPAPKSVKLKKTSMKLNVGETTQMVPVIPAGSTTAYTFSSSDEKVALVSQEGMVTALAKGKATLTVTTHNGLTATLKLTVEDPWFPEEVQLTNAPGFLKAGKSVQLQWAAKPESAVPDFEWTTSDKSVATVDSEGVLTGVSYGYAEITAKSRRNPAIVLKFTVGVETDQVTLEIPARTTSVSGISANLKKIDAIRASAIQQIRALRSGGVITKSDADKRESIINNAFKDYAFPWITLKKQSYWKKANSEGGAKDFKTGRVYYGMPYISGSGRNREYNVAKAVKENRFYDSGKGYYVLNQKNLLKSKYCGNDCSCFVDAAIWGTNSGHSDDRTKDIAKSNAYKTVNSLRTGDLICKGGSHVVMFLYYINADKSKMMIIENGGIEKGTNTVHCMVMNTKWYLSRGYKGRRLKSLG